MAHAQDVFQRLRPDVVAESDHRGAFQAIAPQAEAGLDDIFSYGDIHALFVDHVGPDGQHRYENLLKETVFAATLTSKSPSKEAFEAITQARAEGAEVLIMDTAGRLQNRTELMAELEKMKDEPTLFGPRTFTSEIHHQNRGRYLITEVTNGKPKVIDEWTISEAIPVDYLANK